MTVSERVALANAIAERLQGRQLANLKQNREGNISHSDESGRTKDIAAMKAGLGSGKTLEAAQRVVEHGVPALARARGFLDWDTCWMAALDTMKKNASRARILCTQACTQWRAQDTKSAPIQA